MALTPVPTIDPALPIPPNPADEEAVFDAKAYAWSEALPEFGSDVKAIGDATYANAQWADTKAAEAAAQVPLAAAQVSIAAGHASNAADSATSSLNWATSLTEVSGGLFGAKYYAQQAEAAVSALPAGSINDAVTAVDKAWSSQKVSSELAAKVSKIGDTMTGALNEAAALSVASGATTSIGTFNANTLTITGTTTITSFGSAAAGVIRRLVFSGALTLTHNAASLILPGSTNITTSAGDVAEFLSLGSGNWRCVAYQADSGRAVVGVIGGDTTANVGYLNIPQNSKSAPYTLVISDAGKHILHPSADTTARTFTIPANSSVAFTVGTAITFVNQASSGALTIAIATDTMRLAGTGATGSRTLAANGVATAIKLSATEWIISGTGLT